MSSFWNLVGFEYKKIFQKKSVVIAFAIGLLLAVVSCWGTLIGDYTLASGRTESKQSVEQKNKEYDQALAGRAIDRELLLEVAAGYAKVTPEDHNTESAAFERYIRPYGSISQLMLRIFDNGEHKAGYAGLVGLTEEQAASFYEVRHDNVLQVVSERKISDSAKQELVAMDEALDMPFVFEYTGGFGRFFALMYTTGVVILCLLAICLAPLFSSEYVNRTDQLILSSKTGKGKLIQAKLFTGISLAVLVSVVLTAGTFLGSLAAYGFDGAHAPIQLIDMLSPYSLTLGQISRIYFICVAFASILTAMIAMVLSAKFKSPFGVIVVLSLLIIVPMFINVSEENVFLYNLVQLIPTNMTAWWSVSGQIPYELFGLSIKPYVFMPLFAAVATAVMVPFAYRSFKNHQAN